MPVGQLDGGHIVHAMFGQRIGIAMVKSLDSCCWDFFCSAWIFGVGVYLFFMPIADEPALNDVSELDNDVTSWDCWRWVC